MNVIHAYLDSMFRGYPETERLLEAKAELQGMMEDAYTALIAAGRSENEAVGQVISDFGNLDEVAPALGLDLAPAAASIVNPASAPLGTAGSSAAADTKGVTREPLPVVTLEDAKVFAAAKEQTRFRVATAVATFVLAPVGLIVLPSMLSTLGVGEDLADQLGIFGGILLLLGLIAAGVISIMATERATSAVQYIAEGRFRTNPVVSRWADGLAAEHHTARTRAMQWAIALWILAPVPIIGIALLAPEDGSGDSWIFLGVACVLILVAAGLRILLPALWAESVRDALRRVGQFPNAEHGEGSVVAVIAAFYWPLTVVAYLAWSFLGNAWESSWVIWPIAGVLFGAIAGGSSAIEQYRQARR